MASINLIEAFQEFKDAESIDRPTMMKVVEDVFKTLLRKAFNNDKGYLEAVKIDRSNYGEIILVAGELRLIDSLTTIDNQFMVTDSIDGIGRKAEGTEGKVVFNYALDKYNSKWLDSISKIHFKKYWKSEINFRKSLRK